MIIQKISQNLKNSKLVSIHDNLPYIFVCFMTYNMPTSMKKRRKVPNQKVSRRPKCFSFFFFFLFRQATSNFKIVTLSQWFSYKTAAFYTEQCTSPSLFHNFEVSQGSLNHSLNNYGFISDVILKICMHVHKSLSNETIIIQDCWIRNTVVCMKMESLWYLLLIQCLNRACSITLQPILHTSLRKPMRTGLLLCDRW